MQEEAKRQLISSVSGSGSDSEVYLSVKEEEDEEEDDDDDMRSTKLTEAMFMMPKISKKEKDKEEKNIGQDLVPQSEATSATVSPSAVTSLKNVNNGNCSSADGSSDWIYGNYC
jgi:hypothetical protein